MGWGVLFILALFGTYAGIALILTRAQIKRDENALDQQAYGDCAFVCPEMVGDGRASGNSGGGGPRQSASPSGTHNNHGSHSHDGSEQ